MVAEIYEKEMLKHRMISNVLLILTAVLLIIPYVIGLIMCIFKLYETLLFLIITASIIAGPFVLCKAESYNKTSKMYEVLLKIKREEENKL